MKKFRFSNRVYFFESRKLESIGHGLKMQHFRKFFYIFLIKMSKSIKKIYILNWGYFFESRKLESIGHGLKMQHFRKFSFIFLIKMSEKFGSSCSVTSTSSSELITTWGFLIGSHSSFFSKPRNDANPTHNWD